MGYASTAVQYIAFLNHIWLSLFLMTCLAFFAAFQVCVLLRRGKQIALDIAGGICFLHRKKVAHLDLKSPNVRTCLQQA